MSTPALSIRDLTKNFGPAEIICGVTLDIQPGERHAIIGPERGRQIDPVQSYLRTAPANVRQRPSG